MKSTGRNCAWIESSSCLRARLHVLPMVERTMFSVVNLDASLVCSLENVIDRFEQLSAASVGELLMTKIVCDVHVHAADVDQ